MTLANKNFGLQEKLVELLQRKETPSVSIILRHENPSLDSDKLRLEVKDGIKKALKEMEAMSLNRRLVQMMEERLEKAANEIQYHNYLKGVGLFVSPHVLEIVYFPIDIQPKVVVDDSFEIRDLLLAVNRSFQYDVLLLNKKKTRFFNGLGNNLQEVLSPDIPAGAEDFLKRENKAGEDPAKTESLALEKYVRALDHFLRLYTPVSMPLLLIGDVKLLGYFKKYTRRPNKILGEIEGSYHKESVSEISQKVNESLNAFAEKWENQLLESMKDEIDRLRYVSGIQEAWQAAAMKEARVLITERGYKVPAYSTADGLFLVFEPEFAPGGKQHEDAVDDLIEMVLAQGGESYFVAAGKLKKFDRILLHTRYA